MKSWVVFGKSAFLIGSLLAAATALADRPVPPPILRGPFDSWCALSYRSDSYGRGLEAGFTGASDLRPLWMDESCYQLGIDRAREVRAQNDAGDCGRDFAIGRRHGFTVDEESAGSECFAIGYAAGRAALDVGAREGSTASVGASCVAEYKRGQADAQAQLVASPSLEQRDAVCYLLGHFEGGMFP